LRESKLSFELFLCAGSAKTGKHFDLACPAFAFTNALSDRNAEIP
jgi:hypothetical protein